MKQPLLSGLLLGLLLAGCGETFQERAATEDAEFLEAEYYVLAHDQTLEDDNLVTISRVRSPVEVFIAIHTDADGQPSETVLGYMPYNAGLYAATEVTIELTSLAEGANTLWTVMHMDEGEADVFEFPGVDIPITLDNGSAVMDTFVLTK